MAIIGGSGGYIPLSDRGGVMQDRVVTGVDNTGITTVTFSPSVMHIKITTTAWTAGVAKAVFDAISDAMAEGWLDFVPADETETVEWRQLSDTVGEFVEWYFPRGLDRIDFKASTAATHSFNIEAE